MDSLDTIMVVHAGWTLAIDGATVPVEETIPSEVTVAAIHIGRGIDSARVTSWYHKNKDKDMIAYARGYYFKKTRGNVWLVIDALIDGVSHYINVLNTSFETPFNIKKRVNSGEFGPLISFVERLSIPATAYIR